MIKVSFDYVTEDTKVDFKKYQERVTEIDNWIKNKTGEGNDFLGWYDYPLTYEKAELKRIVDKANEFIKNYEVLVVCGIGGSNLGAYAAIDALTGFLNAESKMEVLFLGNTLDSAYISQLLGYIKDKKFAVCSISKNGVTVEPALGFRLLFHLAEEKYGKDKAKDAIVVVSDKDRGLLRKLAQKKGYEFYHLPYSIGGRFSVMTAVGLFPMACAGIDVEAFLKGMADAQKRYSDPDITKNDAYKYAVQRYDLYANKGFKNEIFVSYMPQLRMFTEWRKQLFNECEGKDKKGILANNATFTTDLHSIGQYIQDGERNLLFETVLYVDDKGADVEIPYDEDNLDELNYLAGKNVEFVNHAAYLATLKAHQFGGVPNIAINIDKLNAHTLGELMFFFMQAVSMSAYLLGVNPYNQPGVEIYKANMLELLGKK